MILDPKTLDDLALLYYGLFSTPTGETLLKDLERVHKDASCCIGPNLEYYPAHVVHQKAGEHHVITRILSLMEIGKALEKNPRKPQTESEDDL